MAIVSEGLSLIKQNIFVQNKKASAFFSQGIRIYSSDKVDRETGEIIADLATASNIYIFDGTWRPQQEIIEVMPAGMKTVVADFKELTNVYIFDGVWDRESEVVRV